MAFLPFLKAAAAAVAKTMNYAVAAAALSSFMAFALLDLSLHVRRSFAAEQLSRRVAARCLKFTIHLREFNPNPIVGQWRSTKEDGKNPSTILINFGDKLPKNSTGK